MDFSAQITRTAEFSSEQRWHSRGKKKCIHLCNLPSATIYFFVSQDMHCVRKKSLFFFPLLITSFSDLSFFCLLMLLQTEIVLQLIFITLGQGIARIPPWDDVHFCSSKRNFWGWVFTWSSKKGKIYVHAFLCCRDNLLQFARKNKRKVVPANMRRKNFRKTISKRVFWRGMFYLSCGYAFVFMTTSCTTWLRRILKSGMQMNNPIKIENHPASN